MDNTNFYSKLCGRSFAIFPTIFGTAICGKFSARMIKASLMDMVFMISGTLLTMALICIAYCIAMKLSDNKMKKYIIRMAESKGVPVDPDKFDPSYKSQSPHSNENCTIIVPDVGIII